jgi:hypothetical protein
VGGGALLNTAISLGVQQKSGKLADKLSDYQLLQKNSAVESPLVQVVVSQLTGPGSIPGLSKVAIRAKAVTEGSSVRNAAQLTVCLSLAENLTTTVSTRFELPRIQGRQVIHITDMKVDFDIQGMAVQFDNLFNGNKVLGKYPGRGNSCHAAGDINTSHLKIACRSHNGSLN